MNKKVFFKNQNQGNFVKCGPIDQKRLRDYLIYCKVRTIKIKLENLLERLLTHLQEADGRLKVFQRFVGHFNDESLTSTLSQLEANQRKIRYVTNELRDDYLTKLLLVNNTVQEIEGRIIPNQDVFSSSTATNWNDTSNNSYSKCEFRSNFRNQEITDIVTNIGDSQRKACLDVRSFLRVNQREEWNDIKDIIYQVLTNSTQQHEESKLFVQFLISTLDQIVRRSKGTVFRILTSISANNSKHLQLPKEQQMNNTNNASQCRICCMWLSKERFSGIRSPWNCQCNGLSDVCTICKNRMDKCPYCRSERNQFCVQ